MNRLACVAALAWVLLLGGCGRSELFTEPDEGGVSDVQDVPDVPDVPDVGCQSNADCAATPATPVCDRATGACVQCIFSADCPAGNMCENNRCVPATTCGGGPACTGETNCCGARCVNTLVDNNNCGRCGTVCAAGQVCFAGVCQSAGCFPGCQGGTTCCSNGCVDTRNDVANCGGCGTVCPPGSTCSAGVCQPPTGCGGGLPCRAGEACCDNRCAAVTSDPGNCGGCGIRCTATQTCQSGACRDLPECSPGRPCANGACCNDRCVDTVSDPTNCGGCGVACGPGQRCAMGRCVGSCGGLPGCPPGGTCCNDRCVFTTADPANCGGCGVACGAGQMCAMGRCEGGCGGGPACPAGARCCVDRCARTDVDPSNCGGCGVVCGAGQRCVAGRCTFEMGCGGGPTCRPGTACCGAACADILNDRNNCGACGVVCGATTVCRNGSCVSEGCGGGPACTAGQTCCVDRCANTQTDSNNCGRCGLVCGRGAACVAGVCRVVATCGGGPACGAGQTCCDGACVDVTSDRANCGACGRACPAPPNTTVSCVTAACRNGPCTAGFGDCNGDPSDGCETNLTTDSRNCGACGRLCMAGGSCQNSTCTTGPSTGTEGAFNPMVNPTYLSPGVHNFTTINVPAGVVVYVAGSAAGGESGVLDLRATGDVTINGVIDVSGGPGSQSTITSRSTRQGRAGAGGFTGDPRTAVPGPACEWVGGVSGGNGRGVLGTTGTCRVGANSACITDNTTQLIFASPVAQFGGGGGVFTGYRAYGAGGGGYAGGAPGALGAPYPGEQDCSGASGGGGATAGRGGSAGTGRAVYDGRNGTLGQTQCPGIMPSIPASYVGGGGGGSIGAAASNDLAVATTFYPGSGGGGGSADYLNRPAFGGTSGGGGGGGALRIWSQTTITINGRVLANGGDGGDAYIGTSMAAGCDPQPGAAGGGGSGGVIFLRAPAITTGARAQVTAVGGAGGVASLYATGGAGGGGGLGRIRLSVDSARCALAGAFNPPLVTGCTVTPAPGVVGRAYVTAYPN